MYLRPFPRLTRRHQPAAVGKGDMPCFFDPYLSVFQRVTLHIVPAIAEEASRLSAGIVDEHAKATSLGGHHVQCA